MSTGIAVSVLVAGVVAFYVFSPLFRGDISLARRVADNNAEARDLQSKYDMLMSSLKDLEDDRATDKIGEQDYADLHARSTNQVIEVMRKLDALNAERLAAQRPIPHPSSTPSGKSA